MAVGRHFEQSKNGHISAKVQAIDTKFGTLMHIGPLNRSICYLSIVLQYGAANTGTVRPFNLTVRKIGDFTC